MLAAGCALAASLIGTSAQAQGTQDSWPSRPIVLLVPSAAGGSPDTVSRILAKHLGAVLNTSVVVDNKPGAAGNIGMSLLARSAPDGYTIGYAPTTNLAINQHLFAKLPYDPARDFILVGEFIRANSFLLVSSELPVKSVADLKAYAAKHPHGIFFGSGGIGTTGHLGGELLKQITGMRMQHVPFQGSPAALQELAAGRIQVLLDNTTSSAPFIQSGKVRAIAISSAERSAHYPDIPTVAESGVPGFQTQGWGGIVVPAKTPSEIVAKLQKALLVAVKDPQFRESFARIGAIPVESTREAFATKVALESAKWGEVVKKAGVTIQ